MLTSLHLRNFRGFADHEVPFRDLTVIVGRNNAGKSTIVEALRLIAIITQRFGSLNFHGVPTWLDVPKLYRGVRPDLRLADFDFETVFYRYGDPPATITGQFASGEKIQIYVGGKSEVHAVVFDAMGKPVPDKARARYVSLPLVSILPQVEPLQVQEEVLNEDYVRRTMDSRLASRHFRNQLLVDPGAYRRFRQLVEQTWSGVRVQELTQQTTSSRSGTSIQSRELSLLVRNEDFVAEASRMGHGLQMWLQTIWFLARTSRDSTVILDEPDVYMHSDLQRRLVRLVRGRHAQAVIATHSTEIISDVPPENIVVVDRSRVRSAFASALPDVQTVIDSLGGVHNVHLARLWSAKRFLIVEGDDVKILGPLHSKLFPNSPIGLESVPAGEAGGWSGWERAAGAAQAMRRAFGDDIQVYCVFDSDYHPAVAITARYDRGRAENIRIHIWGRKEIENFLLVPAVIARAIETRSGRTRVSAAEVAAQIELIVDGLRHEVPAAIINELHALDRRAGPGSAYLVAERWCSDSWRTEEGRWAIASGKAVISALSGWSKETFGVSFNAVALAHAMEASEIPQEMKRFLTAFEEEQPIRFEWRTDPTARAAE